MIRVSIAHGNPLVSAGLAAAFAGQRDFQRVEYGTPVPAPSCAVAVTDFEAGIRLMETQDVRRFRVLIVSDDSGEVNIRRAIELGTRGYMPLSSPVESVIRAVRFIHAGGTTIDPMAMAKIAVSLASPSLSDREMEVLRLMTQGLRNKAIAQALERTEGTAKSHVKSILIKLNAASRAEAIAVAMRRGLLPDDVQSVRSL